MRSLISVDDAMGKPSAIITTSDSVFVAVLTAGVPRQVEVPAAARTVMFSATGPFWARMGGAAVLPVADVLDGSAPELNPIARQIRGTTIGLVAATPVTVNLVFHG